MSMIKRNLTAYATSLNILSASIEARKQFQRARLNSSVLNRMIPVARSNGVIIHCPEDGRYAFFNSPYLAHRLMTGIDIYPDSSFGEITSSPVKGEIIQVRRVKSPKNRFFDDPGYDVVTIIRSTDNPERIVKILHVDSSVDVGETVHPGQNLGTLIRSGYFGFHTPPHAHVEIRPHFDPLRVRGGCYIEALQKFNDLNPIKELKGIVVETRNEYARIQIDNLICSGIPTDVGGITGILDGGIPLYGWFGAHIEKSNYSPVIKLLGKHIGNIVINNRKICVAECTDFKIKLGRTTVDLFFYLTPLSNPFVVVTTKKPNNLNLEELSEVALTVE